jgi:phage terminase large subunit-like protein
VLRIDPAALEALPEPQRREARDLLAEYETELRANPLLGFDPHPKQVAFLSSWEPMKCFFGGNRSGKTTAGILDCLVQAVDRACLPEHLLAFKKWEPPFHCRVITPDFTSTMEGVIFEKLREWAPKAQLVGGAFDKAYDKTLRKLSFKNGSTFDFLTFEQDLDKFGGAAKHRIMYDEEPPHAIRKESMMRLIDYGGDELFTMTPLIGLSWLYDEVWEPYTKGKLVEATVVVVDMDDNPFLDERTKQRALAGLSAEERKARKSGRFVHFAGMIYDEFVASRHVIPERSIGDCVPADARVFTGIDPGMRIMAAVLWAYLTPQDLMVVFDELALQGHTIEQVCDAVKLVNLKHARRQGEVVLPLQPQWYVIDPAARNVSHQTGRSDQSEFVDHGIVTILGQNSVTAGINRVKERLENDRLLITANCTELLSEIRRYRWKTATMRGEGDPKEQPVKTDDHLLDALRYIVMSRPYPSEEQKKKPRMSPLQEAAYIASHPKPRSKQVPVTPLGGIFA